jgi:hypothetical protein
MEKSRIEEMWAVECKFDDLSAAVQAMARKRMALIAKMANGATATAASAEVREEFGTSLGAARAAMINSNIRDLKAGVASQVSVAEITGEEGNAPWLRLSSFEANAVFNGEDIQRLAFGPSAIHDGFGRLVGVYESALSESSREGPRRHRDSHRRVR